MAFKLPQLRGLLAPQTPGRHEAEGRATRTPREGSYEGARRAPKGYTGPRRAATGRATVAPQTRKAPAGRVTPSDVHPGQTRPSPRSRFAGVTGDRQVEARIDYEKRQRAAQHPSQRAGATLRTRPTMGRPSTPRTRFSGPTSAQKNRTATQLNPHAPTVRAKAPAPPRPLPGDSTPVARKRRKPKMSGRDFGGAPRR